jgi:hypothetical protein
MKPAGAGLIRFTGKNCIDAIFICRLRPKCDFALPVVFAWRCGYEFRSRIPNYN